MRRNDTKFNVVFVTSSLCSSAIDEAGLFWEIKGSEISGVFAESSMVSVLHTLLYDTLTTCHSVTLDCECKLSTTAIGSLLLRN